MSVILSRMNSTNITTHYHQLTTYIGSLALRVVYQKNCILVVVVVVVVVSTAVVIYCVIVVEQTLIIG